MAGEAIDQGASRVIAGRYLLVHRLAAGGGASVWLAHDQQLDNEVALKEIPLPGLTGAEYERERQVYSARIRAGARHAAALRGHPHVVTVHDVLEHEGQPWVVMEYVPDAVDLGALVARSGPLAPQDVARIGLKALDALSAGHERGIMHRNVKPSNVLVAPDRSGTPHARVLLTDYDISAEVGDGASRYTRTDILVGTAGYMAPERAMGGPPTAAADLFSLGCTLYFAVEGHGPFDRDTEFGTLTAMVLEEPRAALRAGALWPPLQALLVKDPEERLSAEDARGVLSHIVTTSHGDRPTRPVMGPQPSWSQDFSAEPFSSRALSMPLSADTPSFSAMAPGAIDGALSSPGGDQRRSVGDGLLIALGSAAATAALLAPDGAWWDIATLGVVWMVLTVMGVVRISRGIPTAEDSSVAGRGLMMRNGPQRAKSLLDGFTDGVFFMHPSCAPRERRTKGEYLRDAYNRLGPPPQVSPERDQGRTSGRALDDSEGFNEGRTSQGGAN
ncbi:serine/threonine-protein kinase [Streptomyces turgidiscabies]